MGESSRSARERAFAEHLDATGDYREAAVRAGVSERTGRRWRQRLGRPAVAASADFIGRAPELAALERAWHDGARRIAIVGPPGTGKSRLAREHTRALGRRLGAVAWCDLGGAAVDDLPALLAASFRLPADARSLADGLGRRRAFLVVDDADELALPLAELLASLAPSCPRLRVLVTSRRSLGDACDHELALAPLSLPEASASLDAVREAPAVALLARCTGLRETDPRLLAAVAVELGGIPLALELAAARMVNEDPSAVLADIERGEVGGLDAALEASWRPLDHDQRRVLAAVGHFLDPCTEADIAAVAGVADPGPVLAALAARSLLARDGEGYALLPPVRRFVSVRGDDDLAERRLERLRATAARVDTEPGARRRDFTSALRDALASGDDAAAVDLAGAVDRALAAHGPQPERRRLLTAAADAAARLGDGAARARLLVGVASAVEVSEPGAVAAPLDEAIELAERAGDRRTLAMALADRGANERVAGRLEAAAELFRRAGAALEGCDDRLARGVLASYEATLDRERGRPERAIERSLRALEDLDAAGATTHAIEVRGKLASALVEAGRLDEAMVLFDEVIAAAGKLGDLRLGAYALCDRAALAAVLEDESSARADLCRCVADAGELGDALLTAIARAVEAMIDLDQLRPRAAIVAADAAVSAGEMVGRARVLSLGLVARAAAQASVGEISAAERDLARADAGGVDAWLAVASGFVDLANRRVEGAASLRASLPAIEAAARAPVDGTAAELIVLGRRALAASTRAALEVGDQADATWPPALVSRDGTRLRLAGGNDQELAPVPARLLAALAAARIERPGQVLDHDALWAAGWPGERAATDSARLRLRQAIRALRRQGLAGALCTEPGGWCLDPAWPVAWLP